jgi:hypothetical protein
VYVVRTERGGDVAGLADHGRVGVLPVDEEQRDVTRRRLRDLSSKRNDRMTGGHVSTRGPRLERHRRAVDLDARSMGEERREPSSKHVPAGGEPFGQVCAEQSRRRAFL